MIKLYLRNNILKTQHKLHLIKGLLQFKNHRIEILTPKAKLTTALKHKHNTLTIKLGTIILNTYIETIATKIHNQINNITLTYTHQTRNYLVKLNYKNFASSQLYKTHKTAIYKTIHTLKLKLNTTHHTPQQLHIDMQKLIYPIKIKHLKPITQNIINFKHKKTTPLFTLK